MENSMKLLDIKDTLIEGSWVVKSLDGIKKSFPQNKEAEAREWANTTARSPKQPVMPSVQKSRGPDLNVVWNKIVDVVSNIYPDGDPIIIWLRG